MTSTDAFVLVDKPAGVTSFDVVRQVGRALGTKRTGHSGTLDPFATGLLLVLTGNATRLLRFVPSSPKVYLAEIVFGSERDTDDATGEVTREAPPPAPEAVRRALPALTGALSQVPPDYSAKKVAGRRAYAMARRGEVVALEPADVVVEGWEVISQGADRLTARITCGPGTYIRALARDLGRATGSAAHLAALRRERIGPFDVSTATSWATLREGDAQARPVREALGTLPSVPVDAAGTARLRHGAAIMVTIPDAPHVVALGAEAGAVVAVGHVASGVLHPDVVLPDA